MPDDVLRTVVVDDSVLYRKIIRDILSDIPEVEVVAVARDGEVALQQIERHQPDLVTLDVEMPNLDGLAVLRSMRQNGLSGRAIMVSSTTWSGSKATLAALQEGAFDFVVKPSEGASASENAILLRKELTPRIEALRTSQQFRRSRTGKSRARRSGLAVLPRQSESSKAAPPCPTKPLRRVSTGCYAAVAVGVSTGGPDALRQFLPQLPESFPLPIIVAQHMPPVFTRSLAESLDQVCSLSVSEAEHGDTVEPGRILIAPGGMQTRLKRTPYGVAVQVQEDNGESLCRPSVDLLFASLADVYGRETLGVIMTGMGRDGNIGCRDICRAGGAIIAQDEDSCVVFGMPAQPIAEGLASSVVALPQLATELQQFVGQPSGVPVPV